jgi:hypothetical protein
MKRKVMLLVAVMAVILTAVSANAGITPVGAKQSNANSAARGATYLGVAAGMDATETYLYNQYAPLATGETTGADLKEWVTTSQTGPGWVGGLATCMTAGKVWIVADLGDVYDLSTIKIWNFQWQNAGLPAGDLSNRGIKQFDVYVRDSVADTDDGTAGGTAINLNNTIYGGYLNLVASFNLGTSNPWQLALSDQQLARAPNTDTYAGESYNLTGNTGRFVAIVADSSYGGSGVGLGKVRFDGTLAIPEPATIGILLLGSLMGLRRRR